MEHNSNRTRGVLGGGLVVFLMVPLLGYAAAKPPAAHAKREIPKATNSQVLETYGKLPLTFEANQGQADSQVRFLSRGRRYTLYLTPTEAVLALQGPQAQANPPLPDRRSPKRTLGTVLRMRLVGANLAPRVTGLGELPGKVNSFIGKDPTRWRTNVPTYAKVEYQQVYPGVNLLYYGNQRQLEFDFVVSSGADPRIIALAFEGVDGVAIDAQGDLVLRADAGEVRLRKPVVYQDHDGQRTVIPARYVIKGDRQVAFEVAAYDGTRPLIIDPVLAYSTYLGGFEGDEGVAIAVDGAGNAYLTGNTNSTAFPTFPDPGAFDDTLGDVAGDAFVAKFSPAGALVYSTYVGGSAFDQGVDIAVDGAGRAYVTGNTDSLDFPTTEGAFQSTTFRNTVLTQDAFVAKFDAAGALVYSTYLHGTTHNSNDWASGIAVDAAGSAYVTGFTFSQDFPTTPGAFQESLNSAFSTPSFVTKLDAGGSTLVYSTYLRAVQLDSSEIRTSGIAVDIAGSAYVTGFTTSAHFPTTLGAFQGALHGFQDAFLTKLNPAGSALDYSTYLGGNGSDSGRGIAVDGGGNAYVMGVTGPAGLTGTTDTAIPFGADFVNGFVTKFDTSGALAYVTYLRGRSPSGVVTFAGAIAVDATGSAYLTGSTASTTFPLTPDAVRRDFGQVFGDNRDAFVAKLNPTGSALVYSSYLGGSSSDDGRGIAVDAAGNAYVTGATFSDDFHTPGAFQTIRGGSADAFVTKLSFANPNTPVGNIITVQLDQVTLSFENVTSAGDTTFTPSDSGPPVPAGFKPGNPPTYYELATTATFNGNVTVCITYTGIAFDNEASLRLFHFKDLNWEDVTASLDINSDMVCGSVTSLSPFAILEPAIQQFAAFDARVKIKDERDAREFEAKTTFTLGAGSDGIDPPAEVVSLEVGTFSTTIPAGSFTQDKKGRFKFEGVINGVALEAMIRPLEGGRYELKAEGKGSASALPAKENPVQVSLAIGNDSGETMAAAGSRPPRSRRRR